MSVLERFQAFVYAIGLVVIGMMLAFIVYLLIRILIEVITKIFMWLDILFS